MSLPTISRYRFGINWVALLAIAILVSPVFGAITYTPAGGPVLSYNYNSTPSAKPVPQTVTFSDDTGATVTISGFTITQPSAGSLFAASLSGAASVTVAFNEGVTGSVLTTQATHNGTLNVTVNGQPVQVPLTFHMNQTGGGGTGALTFSPNPMTFTTASNTQIPGAQFLNLTSTAGATSFTATASSTGNWLTFSATGTNQVNGVFSAGFAQIAVQVNPTILSNGLSYQGIIQVVTSPDNLVYSLPVTLNVGTTGSTGLLTVTPNPITFSAPFLNVSPSTQIVSVSTTAATTGVTYTATAFSSGWLYINNIGTIQTTGSLPTSFIVGASTFGLPANTYTGSITISTGGTLTTSQTIQVTLVVGAGGGSTGAVVLPTSLTFTGQAGAANRPGVQYIGVGGTGSYTVTPTMTTGSGWLTVDSTSGSAPYFITVTANSSGLSAGSYTGNVQINQGGLISNVPVTLTLSGGASVIANPSGVFIFAGGGTQSTSVDLRMSDGSAGQSVTITPSASWITVSPATTLPATVAVSVNSASLANGLNSGTISIAVPGAANSPLTIPVVVYNTAGSSGGGTGTGPLLFSNTSLSFTSSAGETPTSQFLTVYSNTGVLTSFSATPSANWITVSPTVSTTGNTLTVSVVPSAASAGTNSGSISFTANGQTQTVPVTFTVSGPSITASPTSLTFSATGSTAPPTQTISVSSTTSGTGFTASATISSGGTNWLSVSPQSGTTPGSLTVSVNPANLSSGTYSGTISITPTGGSATNVSVSLTVTAPPTVSASPATLTFNYRSGEAAPATQQIQVSAQNSNTPLNFSAAVTTGGSWLAVTPSSGQTPGTLSVNVTPGNLDPGTYNGVITVSGTGAASASSSTVNVTLTVTAPLPTITRVVNNASYTSGALAPGEIVTIAGTFIGPNEPATGGVDSSTNRITTTLGNVQVLFNGIPGPLLYVSSTQINAIVPYGVAGRLDCFVQVRFRGATSNTVTLAVTSAVPGIYTQNSQGSGPGAILNQNGSLNGPGNAAAKGSVISIYATGEGLSRNANGAAPETGQVIPRVTNIADLPRPLLPVAVLIDGQPATVTYAGSVSELVAGVLQVNAIVPQGARSGPDVPIVISVGNNSSQTGVTVAIQ